MYSFLSLLLGLSGFAGVFVGVKDVIALIIALVQTHDAMKTWQTWQLLFY